MENILKVFVGVGDTDELDEMYQEARREGFKWVNGDDALRELMVGNQGADVEIRGGLVDICVPKAIKLVLGNKGMGNVEVDLEQVRCFWSGKGEEGWDVAYRRSLLEKNLVGFLSDERLRILPELI